MKFYDVFDNFSRIYEVTKFGLITLCFDVSDLIHANKHTKYVNCGLIIIMIIIIIIIIIIILIVIIIIFI